MADATTAHARRCDLAMGRGRLANRLAARHRVSSAGGRSRRTSDRPSRPTRLAALADASAPIGACLTRRRAQAENQSMLLGRLDAR